MQNAAIDLLAKKSPSPLSLPPVNSNEQRSTPVSGTITPIREGLEIGISPPLDSELPIDEPTVTPVTSGEQRFKRLKLATSNGEQVSRYVSGDVSTGEVVLSLADEATFIEFWGFDLWEMIASVLSMTMGIDASCLETDEDEKEQAKKAASVLFKMSQKYPKLFGWMASTKTIEGGDWMVVAMFYGGKFGLAFKEWTSYRKKKRQP